MTVLSEQLYLRGGLIKMGKEPLVSVVIVNWNRKEDLRECLESLRNQTYKNVEIIVVDNCSTDGSIEMIKRDFPEVKLIVMPDSSYGAIETYNIGIKEASGEFILHLDNDTILNCNVVEELVRVMNEDSKVGVVGPKILFWDHNGRKNIIWFAGGIADIKKGKIYHKKIGKPDDKSMEIEEVDFITGCCMLIRKNILDKIGVFDESLFIYCDDIDFCLRAKKAGFKILYNPKAVVWHKVSATSKGAFSSRKAYFKYRNTIILIRKHGKLTIRNLMNVLIDAVLYSHGSFKTDKRDFLYTPFKILKGILDGIKMELKRL